MSEVNFPEGQCFAFVLFKDDADAKKVLEGGVRNVNGAQCRVQPGKEACKEVSLWKQELKKKLSVNK